MYSCFSFSEHLKSLLSLIVRLWKLMPSEKKAAVSQYNPGGKQLEAFLGPLEASIIEIIWCSEKRPITVREVLEVLKKKKPIAYTTVMNTMNRLYEKGLLDRRIEKKSKKGMYLHYVYWPKLEKQNFKEAAVRQVLSSLLDNFDELVTTCFIEKAATNDKLKSLKERIDKTLRDQKA